MYKENNQILIICFDKELLSSYNPDLYITLLMKIMLVYFTDWRIHEQKTSTILVFMMECFRFLMLSYVIGDTDIIQEAVAHFHTCHTP